MVKKIFLIKGMSCNSCAHLIEKSLKDKVNSVSVSFSREEAEVDFNPEKISEKEIKEIIEEEGYEIVDEIEESEDELLEKSETQEETEIKSQEDIEEPMKNYSKHRNKLIVSVPQKSKINVASNPKENSPDKFGWLILIISIAILIFIIYYFFLKGLNLEIPALGDKTSLLLLFGIGILTGFHCIAMCGGFVVSYTAKNAIKGHKSYKQHLVYGGSKLLSYTLIGGLFGLVGGVIAFSVGLRGWVAILAGVFMIFYSLSMFGFKFFRKFQFNPKFLTKAASNASMKATGPYKAPMITGLLNGLFIACGPLQAMYLYAMGTGSFVSGFLSLGAFGLGTLPIMIGFGTMATTISHQTAKKILKFSAILVLILGLIMLNRGLTVLGSPYSLDSIKESVINPSTSSSTENSAIIKDGFQEINMDINSRGYSPNSFVLKKGVPVKWNINVKELTGCNKELVARDYNIDVNLKKGIQTIEFTPTKEGTIRFSCGMGMLRGSFIVTESGEVTQEELASAAPSSGGSCSMGANGGGCGCGG